MLSNYLTIALRNIARNKLYAAINILGLAMGLVLFIFGGIYSEYEYNHDTFFKNYQRTYTLSSIFGKDSGVEGVENNTVYTAVASHLRAEHDIPEAIARTVIQEFLISVEDDNYYQQLRFADADLLKIFDFDYIQGDSSALNNTNGALLTRSMALKLFNDVNVIGKTLILNHQNSFQVTAVIEDLPRNSHFNSMPVFNVDLELVLPITAMERVMNFAPDENFGLLSSGNMTYVMLPEEFDQEWLQTQVNGVYERHYSDETKRFIGSIKTRPLKEANTAFWDMVGVPTIEIVRLLGLAVLLIACVNYTNLATAQSLGRAREVGLRKTLGAGPRQLLTQFIIESITIAAVAMIVALCILEALIPTFNNISGKGIELNYVSIAPWLLATTLAVGIISGAYPAYLITKTSPIEALRDGGKKGRASAWIRSSMIAIQFAISVFMLALVSVVYAQNKNVEQSSNVFDKDHIYTLGRLDVDQIAERHEILRNELLAISGVENFSLSSQVPFETYQNMFLTSRIITDIPNGFNINQVVIDPEFLTTYGISIVAGRTINRDVALDTHVRENGEVNVLINKMAARSFGFDNPDEAIGEKFYEDEGERGITTYNIVGVTEDINIMGVHQQLKSFVFFMRPASYRFASLTLSNSASINTIREIERVWNDIIPEFPIQGQFLNAQFQLIYSIFDMGSKSLTAFAIFALVLALIGLFGLAAFMAEWRTREIGIRKVLGANSHQIAKLLIWQFSKPVLLAIPFALGLAYFASNTYLELFDDRIGLPYASLLIAGGIGMLLSWATVATHAYKVANTNPVNALHYE